MSRFTRKEIRDVVDTLDTINLMYLLRYAITVRLKITDIWYLRYLDEH